jgi:hypothetical protein
MLSIAAEAAQAMLAQCTTMDVAILSGCNFAHMPMVPNKDLAMRNFDAPLKGISKGNDPGYEPSSSVATSSCRVTSYLLTRDVAYKCGWCLGFRRTIVVQLLHGHKAL